jgi:hypothetical protein
MGVGVKMDCTHFKKAKFIKRIMGIQGYCTLHDIEITNYNKIQYHPYIYCKGQNGEILKDCDIELRMNSKKT